MRSEDALLVAVLATVIVQRAVELVVSRRNLRRLVAQGAVRAPHDGLTGIVAAHAALYVALPIEWWNAPWVGVGAHTAPALLVALAASALRYWAAVSLGPRYTIRVVRAPDVPLVAGGPYRWMRHPIYRAVAVELPAIPLAFGAVGTALLLFVGQSLALAHRIRVEERHLGLA